MPPPDDSMDFEILLTNCRNITASVNAINDDIKGYLKLHMQPMQEHWKHIVKTCKKLETSMEKLHEDSLSLRTQHREKKNIERVQSNISAVLEALVAFDDAMVVTDKNGAVVRIRYVPETVSANIEMLRDWLTDMLTDVQQYAPKPTEQVNKPIIYRMENYRITQVGH